MISRYSRDEMARIWSDDNKFRLWLEIELAVCAAWAELGKIPMKDLAVIKKRASFNLNRISKIEKTVKHDVIAFLTAVAEKVGPSSRFIHMGMTSSDVLDTALALQLKGASGIIIGDLKRVLVALKKKAFKYKHTPMIGRSHGVHAEPTTFGLKMALFYDEFQRDLGRMKSALNAVSVGKISGAVGTYANIPPEVESMALKRLGLKPAKISTQVVQRDIHAEFFTTLAIIASSVEKLAVEVRHLQRTEVLEVEEGFSRGQKGSSAMPHKRNPVLSENLTGLARVVRSNAIAALEDVSLWHERDISHSSVERIIAPDSTILVDFMLARLADIIEGLIVYPEQMKANIGKTRGLIFSGQVMLTLVDKGMSREAAYQTVQRNAMKSWKRGEGFKEFLVEDREVMKYLSGDEIREIFNLEYHLKYVDRIFGRVFG